MFETQLDEISLLVPKEKCSLEILTHFEAETFTTGFLEAGPLIKFWADEFLRIVDLITRVIQIFVTYVLRIRKAVSRRWFQKSMHNQSEPEDFRAQEIERYPQEYWAYGGEEQRPVPLLSRPENYMDNNIQ